MRLDLGEDACSDWPPDPLARPTTECFLDSFVAASDQRLAIHHVGEPHLLCNVDKPER